MAWQYPEGGRFSIAVPGDEDIVKDVETFFGGELARYNHSVYWEHCSYVVFFFSTMSDAEKCIEQFNGRATKDGAHIGASGIRARRRND